MTAKLNFPAFRNAWLDQVAVDDSLPPMAFKLAWFFMKDCQRSLTKHGSLFSYRSQHGYADLLGVKTRHVRDLFTALRDRGHIEVKRAGKGNPNRTFPTLFDRQNSAGHDEALTGTLVPYDRHSHDIMTGTIVPGNLIEKIQGGESVAGLQPATAVPAGALSSTIKAQQHSTAKGSSARDRAPPDDENEDLSWMDEPVADGDDNDDEIPF